MDLGGYREVMDHPATHPDTPPTQPAQARVSLEIDADPERVWQALTTGDGLAVWMGSGASLEPEPGGSVVLPDPVGGETRRGRVRHVEQGQRLDFTWWPALRPARQTDVSITLTPLTTGPGGRCRVEVVETLVPSTTAATGPTAATNAAAAEPGTRSGANRLPIGLWSWRLAVLSVSACLSRV